LKNNFEGNILMDVEEIKVRVLEIDELLFDDNIKLSCMKRKSL
jgi:hypothetical protein